MPFQWKPKTWLGRAIAGRYLTPIKRGNVARRFVAQRNRTTGVSARRVRTRPLRGRRRAYGFRRKRPLWAQRKRKALMDSLASQPLQRAISVDPLHLNVTTTNSQGLFNDNCVVAGNGDFVFLTSSYASIKQFIMKRITATFEFVNQDVKPTRMTLYYWKCCADVGVTAAYTNLTAVINTGFAVASGGATTNGAVPGVTPFDSSRFGSYFKCYKSKEVTLQPGEPYRCKLTRHGPWMWDTASVDPVNNQAFRGITLGICIVVHPMAVNDATTKTNVGIGLAKINQVATYEYVFGVGDAPAHTFTASNTLGTIAAEEFINPLTDAIIAADSQA